MTSQLTVRLPADLRKALETASRETGIKHSEMVRLALRAYLQIPADRDERPAERVRALLGSIESGLPDLPEKHRDYILECLRRDRRRRFR